MTTDQKGVRIAVIGLGRWGSKIFGNLRKSLPIVAVAEGRTPKTKEWMAVNHPDIPVLPYDEILERQDINAIVVMTPIGTHLEIASPALRAGKDVFLEKPGGRNGKELEELGRLARENGRILMVGYIQVYHPAWRRILEILKERGETPQALYTYLAKWGAFDEPYELNILCHYLALAETLFGKEIEARRLPSPAPLKEHVGGCEILRGERVLGFLEVNRFSPGRFITISVQGEKSAFISQDLKLFEVVDEETREIEVFGTPLEEEMRVFLKCVKTRQEPPTDARFGLEVHRLLEGLDA